jgi:NADH/NAD ratio-sensing transcriptional regulator Rex
MRQKQANQPSNRRLETIRRIIELPELLKGREWSMTQLADLYQVDKITIRRDMFALGEYWPIKRIKWGREVYFSLPKAAKPVLMRMGRRR